MQDFINWSVSKLFQSNRLNTVDHAINADEFIAIYTLPEDWVSGTSKLICSLLFRLRQGFSYMSHQAHKMSM